MARTPTRDELLNPIVDQAARLLFNHHDPASYDANDRCTSGGYRVQLGTAGRVRVDYRDPAPDPLDLTPPTPAQLAPNRARMVTAYADTFRAAGWTVELRTQNTPRPLLLATPPTVEESWEPADFDDFAHGDRIRFLTTENGYGGRGIYVRTGTVHRITGHTLVVTCDDGTTARLVDSTLRAREPYKLIPAGGQQ